MSNLLNKNENKTQLIKNQFNRKNCTSFNMLKNSWKPFVNALWFLHHFSTNFRIFCFYLILKNALMFLHKIFIILVFNVKHMSIYKRLQEFEKLKFIEYTCT